MSVVLLGSTSGSVTLQEPAVAGSTVIDLPATSGTMAVLPTATSVLPEASGGTGTTTGYYGFKNRIINGAMVIDQRNAGAAVTVNSTSQKFSADRFFGQGQSTDGVFTLQQSLTAPAGFSNSVVATVTTADASIGATQFYLFAQTVEGFNTSDLSFGTASARTVTLSFWTRSSLTGTFGGVLTNDGFTRSYPFTYSISVADTWEYKTITIAGDTSGTWVGSTNGIGLRIFWGLGVGSTYSGTAGAWAGSTLFSATSAVSVIGTLNATWYITGVQLEKGSTATSFDYRPYGTELALCQRYYQAYYGSNSSLALIGRNNAVGAGSSYPISVPIKVSFRVAPTGTIVGTWVVNNASQPAFNGMTTEAVGLVFNSSGAGDTFAYPNSTSVGLTLSAEL